MQELLKVKFIESLPQVYLVLLELKMVQPVVLKLRLMGFKLLITHMYSLEQQKNLTSLC